MMSYSELLMKYESLLRENETLRQENELLRSQLAQLSSDQVCSVDVSVNSAEAETESNSDSKHNQNVSVTHLSSPDEKIRLFRSLFRGREDVFARRWHNSSKGTSGYQPVCENEWNRDYCDKTRFRCSQCPNRIFVPLDDKHVFDHLAGKDIYCRDVIGIYPLLEDDTCFFLCVDFDEASYEKDVIVFASACDDVHLPAYIERSRSGNGAHVWIFFEKPIPAQLARKMGACLITSAMRMRSELKFKSYDRMFPNQDFRPNGGLGNLVALPLQGRARKDGNSLFVNRDFQPFADQWAYLSSVKRISREMAESIVSKLGKQGELGTLLNAESSKPWVQEKAKPLTAFDFTQTVQIVRSNMIFVRKEGISELALNEIKRLAAFKNPDFYRAQAMRLPTYGKPRVICTAEHYYEYLAIPRGCETALIEKLNQSNVPYEITDETNSGKSISVTFNGTLREEQQPALDSLLRERQGVLSATTAFGKTVVASNLIAERKTNTLILVHTQALLNQWKQSLEQFLTLDVAKPEEQRGRGRRKIWSPVGTLGAGKDTLHGVVDVAIMQSLITDHEVKELVRDYGMIIVDECHHVSAVSFEQILRYANAKYVYGLTATPFRQDGHQPIIFMQCGPVRYLVDAKSQAEKRAFHHYLIPRFTNSRLETDDMHISAKYKALVEDSGRNAIIIKDVKDILSEGRNPIIITERKDHAFSLAEMLKNACEHVITLTGSGTPKEKREARERLDMVPSDESFVIVATGKYVGEGFDYPRLDTLFLTLPISSKGSIAQYAGRLHRESEGKKEVRVYDYVDVRIPDFDKMYQKRLKGYAAIGYKVKGFAGMEPSAESETKDVFYDEKTYEKALLEDIMAAKKEILIVSPRLHPGKVKRFLDALLEAHGRGVSVCIHTKNPDELKLDMQEGAWAAVALLEEYNFSVEYKPGLHQKLAVIDNEIVWYGSMDLLAYSRSEENFMRVKDSYVADELISFC